MAPPFLKGVEATCWNSGQVTTQYMVDELIRGSIEVLASKLFSILLRVDFVRKIVRKLCTLLDMCCC